MKILHYAIRDVKGNNRLFNKKIKLLAEIIVTHAK